PRRHEVGCTFNVYDPFGPGAEYRCYAFGTGVFPNPLQSEGIVVWRQTKPFRIGACVFTGTPCFVGAECGVPGLCFAASPFAAYPPGTCLQRCASDADCASQGVCSTIPAVGSVCVGCGSGVGHADETKCAPEMTCVENECHQLGHPECTSDGADCIVRE